MKLLRALGLIRSVGKRSLADWPLVLSAWLLLVCATTLIASSIAYSESVASGGFHKVITSSDPAETAVRVFASVSATELDGADRTIKPLIENALGGPNGQAAGTGLDTRGTVSVIATTDGLSLATYDPSDQTHQILVGTYADIARHATLTAGAWPSDGGATATTTTATTTTADQRPAAAGSPAGAGADPCAGTSGLETALSAQAAKALDLAVGGRTTLASKLRPAEKFDVCVAGIYEPDPNDRFWLGAALELTGTQVVGAAVTRGPFVVTPQGLARLAGGDKLTAEWRWLPDIGSIAPSDADRTRAAVTGLQDRAQATYSSGYVWVESGLPDILAAATKSLLVAQSSSLLLFAQFVILAVYAILLVGGMLVERRRPEAALLRSRGAAWPHLALLAFGEALLLAVPAVLVAPFLAQAVVSALAVVGPLAGEHVVEAPAIDAATWAAAVVAGIGCVAVLTIPSLPGVGSLSGVRAALSRGLGRTLAQRLGLDVLLAVLAAVALWQLQSYGSPITTTVRGDLGIDPLLVAAPAIGLLAGALLATRLVPRLGELAERAFERATGLATPFLARQMGRRPLRYTRIALLLMLAAAMGTFAAAFAATWSDSQAEQAAYQSGGDLRVTLADRSATPAWSLAPRYRALPGVEAVAAAGPGRFDVGRDLSGGQLLALQSGALDTASVRVTGTEGLRAQVAGLGRWSGASVALPGRPTQLGIRVAVNLTMENATDNFGAPVRPDVDVAVSVVVADDAGTYRLEGPSIPADAKTGTSALSLAVPDGSGFGFSGDVRILGVELTVESFYYGSIAGTVELLGLDIRDGPAGSWQPIGGLPAASGWSWSATQGGRSQNYSAPAGRPGLVELGNGESQVVPASGGGGQGSSVLRYAADPGTDPLEGIANQALLDATGARSGDTILISQGGYETRVRIKAVAPMFPTLDPAKPFLVVDGGSLAASDYEQWSLVDAPKELWLRVSPGSETHVKTAILGGSYAASAVDSRFDVERAGRADPISLGVIGALFLGSLAAMLLAAIGFLVNAAFMARERNGELAVLRALGERPGTIAAMLVVEQLLLLGFGLAGGALLGFVLGWLAIPFAWLTPAGTVPVPAPSIAVPWLELAAIALPVVAMLLVVAALLIRSSLAGPAAPALRRQDVAP